MNVADAINEMRRLGKDPGDAVWADTEKLGFFNRAVKLLCQLKPNIHTSRETVTCAAGPVQNVPPGMRFVRVTGLLVAGSISKAIMPVDDAELTGYLPGWRGLAAVSEPEHYIFDPAKPDSFELYPPVSAGVTVQILAETFPADSLATDELPLDQVYFEPLCLTAAAVMLYENDADLPLADKHLNKASRLLGVKVNIEHAVSTD